MATFWQGPRPWHAFEHMRQWDDMDAPQPTQPGSRYADEALRDAAGAGSRRADSSEQEAFVHRAIQFNYYR